MGAVIELLLTNVGVPIGLLHTGQYLKNAWRNRKALRHVPGTYEKKFVQYTSCHKCCGCQSQSAFA
jgi:hypothetical protein